MCVHVWARRERERERERERGRRGPISREYHGGIIGGKMLYFSRLQRSNTMTNTEMDRQDDDGPLGYESTDRQIFINANNIHNNDNFGC